jgi:hypothetical protein
MNYDAVVASAMRSFPRAREFQGLFPNAEHAIVDDKRDFHPDGWKPVCEWISRSHLHDRYVVWLVVAIDIAADGTISELEKPVLYVVELEKAESCRDDEEGASWEVGCAEFEEGDWERLVNSGGDFAAVEFDMKTDSPVNRFATFWNDTRPTQRFASSDGMAIKAPIRFMT